MSTASPRTEIDYPESDGKPMGETDLHRDWMVRIMEILRRRYAGQKVYVASNLLVYYEEGQPTKFIVPDDFVVFDCEPQRRRVFKTWEEKRVPNVVFEVTSRSTSSTDLVDKPVIYERMGVHEYFLFDPGERFADPSLIGYRLIEGSFHEIPKLENRLASKALDLTLAIQGRELKFYDAKTGDEQLTPEEFEQLEKEREREARLKAEARIRELEEELRRMKGQ